MEWDRDAESASAALQVCYSLIIILKYSFVIV